MLSIHPTPRGLGYQDSHGCCNGNEDQDASDYDYLPLGLVHISPACTLGASELLLPARPLLLCAAWIWVDTALASGQEISSGIALRSHGCEAHLEVSRDDVGFRVRRRVAVC